MDLVSTFWASDFHLTRENIFWDINNSPANMDSTEMIKCGELMHKRNRKASEPCVSILVNKCLFSRMQGKGLVLTAQRRECCEKEPIWALRVFFAVIPDPLWPSPILLLMALSPVIWRAISLLNKLCWCYVETTLIKVCMWWVRKRRAFKLTESGPVVGGKKECQNDTRKSREVQTAIWFELRWFRPGKK